MSRTSSRARSTGTWPLFVDTWVHRGSRLRPCEGRAIAGPLLLAHDLDDHPFLPLPVPLPVEHPLPRSQVELARGHGHDHLVSYGETPEVGGGVVLPGVIVLVPLGTPRRDRVLEPLQDVLPEAGLVVVDEHRGADVHRRDECEAFSDPALAELRFGLVSDVDDLLAAFGLEPEVVRVRGHGYSSWMVLDRVSAQPWGLEWRMVDRCKGRI